MHLRNFAVLMALFFVSVAAWAADISGTWTGSAGDFTLTYTFKQDGDKVTGTVLGPQGDPLPLVNLKIEGDKISFAVKVDMGGNAVTFTSKGTIAGNEMKLTSTNDGGMDFGGEQTLKKQAK